MINKEEYLLCMLKAGRLVHFEHNDMRYENVCDTVKTTTTYFNIFYNMTKNRLKVVL